MFVIFGNLLINSASISFQSLILFKRFNCLHSDRNNFVQMGAYPLPLLIIQQLQRASL